MAKILFLASVLMLLGCKNTITEQDLPYLNGYWEIERVTFPNGQAKEYKVNATIDYIELKGLKGFRKKVQPKFDGTYQISNNDLEAFSIIGKQGVYTLYYKNKLSEWDERLVEISKNSFSVTNADHITYTYKRYQPINGKESK